MLILLVGTGIFLTVRTRFLTWRNLGYALKSTLSKEAAPRAADREMYPLFPHWQPPSVPEISSVLPQPWFPVVPELWYGTSPISPTH